MSATNNRASATSASAMPAKKLHIGREEWDRRLSQITLSKHDMNKLVMNYLVIEGYKDAAEKFSMETGIRPTVEFAAIEDRMHIRTAIQSGQIEKAIDRINSLNPDILDCNPKLTFQLQLQQFIELIRAGEQAKALEFAQEQLAPLGESNPEFLLELERAMTLFLFEPGAIPTSVADLLEPFYRIRTANEVNTALLSAQSQEKDSKLPTMLKLLDWAQSQLGERIEFPKMIDYATGKFEEPMSTS